MDLPIEIREFFKRVHSDENITNVGVDEVVTKSLSKQRGIQRLI